MTMEEAFLQLLEEADARALYLAFREKFPIHSPLHIEAYAKFCNLKDAVNEALQMVSDDRAGY